MEGLVTPWRTRLLGHGFRGALSPEWGRENGLTKSFDLWYPNREPRTKTHLRSKIFHR